MIPRTFFLCALVGCAGASSRAPTPAGASCASVSTVAWLRGRWCGPHRDGTFCETWRDDGGALAGEGRFERDGARVFGEALRIEDRDGAVFYVATPEGEGATAFRLVRCERDVAVFENLAHDFPTRITYRRASAEGLAATVEGSEDGGARRVEFTMSRAGP